MFAGGLRRTRLSGTYPLQKVKTRPQRRWIGCSRNDNAHTPYQLTLLFGDGEGQRFEVPPPGAGLATVTFAVPALATSDFRICAVTLPGPP